MAASSEEAMLAVFNDLIAKNPDAGAYAYFNRANMLAELGRHEEALRDYDHVIAVEPAYGEDDGMPGAAWYNRGNSLWALGRLEEAIASYDEALALCGDDYPDAAAGILFNKASIALAQDRRDEALALLEKSIEIDPEAPEAHIVRAHTLADLGRGQEALELLERQALEWPGWSDHWTVRAEILLKMHAPEQARQLLLQMPGEHWDDPPWWCAYLDSLVELSRPDEAMEQIERLLSHHPDWAEPIAQRYQSKLGTHPRWATATSPR